MEDLREREREGRRDGNRHNRQVVGSGYLSMRGANLVPVLVNNAAAQY